MLTHVLFFVLGLAALVAGAEALVRGASKIALSLGISPLFEKRTPLKRVLVLAITSNRGLCGGYNANLVRKGRAEVDIRMKDAAAARVWSLATSGRRLAPVKTQVVNGSLVIPLNVDAGGKARMMYEVELP